MGVRGVGESAEKKRRAHAPHIFGASMTITLSSCPKTHTRELDKALPPAETVARVKDRLAGLDLDILSETKRIDTGRLNIPVYLSLCGTAARNVMPTRKQMGKGASAVQAEASALMELMERFSFFTFWRNKPGVVEATWSEAEARFGAALMPVEEMLRSVNDALAPEKARLLLDLLRWDFFPATDLSTMRPIWTPLNWFKKLGEFNGTSAGNTEEESLLQGLCELVERHVCCLVDRALPELPTIDPASVYDPVLLELLDAFAREGVSLVLKDFSLGMPVPTVGAVAWDESTFPTRSEIVYTAGAASTPAKAAIRAVTEVAQLAGDFCTGACYEASGLSKYTRLEDIAWLRRGPMCRLDSLPSVASDDILEELRAVVDGLAALGFRSCAVSTMHPEARVHTHYCFAPGLAFRERDKNQSLGLFVGRMLAEEADAATAERGLTLLEECYAGAHFIPFFRGILALRKEDFTAARRWFAAAEPAQPENDARGMTAFYAGYALTLEGRWAEALPALGRAVGYCPDMKEYWNLRGVARFKTTDYAGAAEDFSAALRIDKGSVTDIANLGLCHKFLGNTNKARHYLAAALDIDPRLDFARTHLEELNEQRAG